MTQLNTWPYKPIPAVSLSTTIQPTMQRYIIKSQSGINGLELQSDAPIPKLTGPYDVSPRA
jgi:hypothetical protein